MPPSSPLAWSEDPTVTFALTGEKVTEATLFACPSDGAHVSAFQAPIEKSKEAEAENLPSGESEKATDQALSSIGESLVSLRSRAYRAFKKSPKIFASPRSKHRREPQWMEAEHNLQHLHHDDADMLRLVLSAANENYSGGKLYFRKIHVGESGAQINWQVKFEHKTRGCEEQAIALKDAARKVKSYLDFKEPGDTDQRFKPLYDYIRSNKRFSGALLLFKEGKGKDFYPWKLRVHHETRGFTKVSNTLSEAIRAMEEHLEYEEATSEEQQGLIWERIFTALEKYPKCKVFFKEVSEDGPHGEPERTWRIKVDHPIRGIQFEAKSRIFQEAAGQVYDYLEDNKEDTMGT